MDDVFQCLLPEDRRFLYERSRERRFQRGEVVFHQRDPGDTLHFVRRGRLAVLLSARKGRIILDVAGVDALVGEIVVLGGGRRSSTVKALEPTVTREFRSEDFTIIRKKSETFDDVLLAGLAQRLIETTEMVAWLIFASVEERLIRELAVLCGAYAPVNGVVTIPMSQGDLGDFVGATRQTVNRSLAKLRGEGIVGESGRKKQVSILRPALLLNMAAKLASTR